MISCLLINRLPRSCIRNQSQENLLERTKIVLAVPSYHRQRLSGIRRGWCPSRSRGMKRVIRSDSGVAHRLSSSARVLSAADSQVKAKRQRKKRLCHMHNRRAREVQPMTESPLWRVRGESCRVGIAPSPSPAGAAAGGESSHRTYYPDVINLCPWRRSRAASAARRV